MIAFDWKKSSWSNDSDTMSHIHDYFLLLIDKMWLPGDDEREKSLEVIEDLHTRFYDEEENETRPEDLDFNCEQFSELETISDGSEWIEEDDFI